MNSNDAQPCRCRLHDLQARRHQAYRNLALTILGPAAPQDDAALAEALAEHARLLKAVPDNVTRFRSRRVA